MVEKGYTKMSKKLFLAVREGDLQSFKEELAKIGVTGIISIDIDDQTALHVAANFRHFEIVEYILTNFLDANIINDIDQDGNTALHLAATPEIYDLLIAYGAVITENYLGQLPGFVQSVIDDGASVGAVFGDVDEEVMSTHDSVDATVLTADVSDYSNTTSDDTFYLAGVNKDFLSKCSHTY